MAATAAIGAGSAAFTQGATSLAGAYTQSKALKAKGDYDRMVGEENAKLSEVSAEDAIRRGDIAASRQKAATAGLVGQQRAAYASQGVDVNSGSAKDVQIDTERLGAMDAIAIRNNAWREAWGYKQQSLQASFQGQFAQMAADNEAGATLLGGGMRALGSFEQGAYMAIGKGGK